MQIGTPAFIARLEGAAVLLDAFGRRLLAVPMLEVAGIGFGRGDRRAQRDALGRHRLEHLGGAAIAMLDRVGAGADGAHHAFGGGGVDRDEAAGVVGGGDARVELGLGQGRPASARPCPNDSRRRI